jgi:hypothetical protein
LITSQLFNVGFKIGHELLHGYPRVEFLTLVPLTIAIVAMIAFATLVVVSNQALARMTIIKPVLKSSSVVNLLVILQAGNALLMSSIGHSRLVVEALSG